MRGGWRQSWKTGHHRSRPCRSTIQAAAILPPRSKPSSISHVSFRRRLAEEGSYRQESSHQLRTRDGLKPAFRTWHSLLVERRVLDGKASEIHGLEARRW